MMAVLTQEDSVTATFTQFTSKIQNPNFENVMDIDPQEILQLKDKIKLVDVRQPEEYTGELGHIPGTELVVLGTLPEHIQNLPKDQTIVFVCRSGGRSAQATAFAKSQGFTEVYNMLGGMLLWNEKQLPIER